MNRTEQQNTAGPREHFDDNHHDDAETLEHKREVKRMLEERLEQKRLKNELEDFDGELEGDFDWDKLEP
ncbi:MAG: hypothetical protein P1U36_01570 [Legionellaceae bacterium]|nr:hypothetical protein [Legionellaceae bacterium]